jgi:predicted permease
MDNIAMLFLCLAIGMALRKFGRVPDNAHTTINAFIPALYAGLIGLRGRTTEVTLFEAAMPPQLGGSIVAIQYGLDAKLISLMVGVGTVAAFLTLPAWSRAFALF